MSVLDRHVRIALSFVIVVALAGCVRQSRVTALEVRLAAMEAQQARDRKALDVAVRRLRAMVDRAQIMDALEQIETKLDELDQKVAKAKSPPRRRPEPKGTDVYAVPIAGAPAEGPADALVTIVRAYEYACPYCEKSRKTLAELRQRYPDELRVVYKSFVVHPQVATLPAQAACAAHRQGLFSAYDSLLWSKAFANRTFDQTTLEALATEAGLDLDVFRTDLAGDCVADVARDQYDMKQVGVGATPTFFINGRYLSGAQSVETFAAIIDAELATAQARLQKTSKKKRGKARASYYQTWVLDQGLPQFDPPAD
jgi:protein-disulfide isomerase